MKYIAGIALVCALAMSGAQAEGVAAKASDRSEGAVAVRKVGHSEKLAVLQRIQQKLARQARLVGKAHKSSTGSVASTIDLCMPESPTDCAPIDPNDWEVYVFPQLESEYAFKLDEECPDGYTCITATRPNRWGDVLCVREECREVSFEELGRSEKIENSQGAPEGLYDLIFDSVTGGLPKTIHACNGLPMHSNGRSFNSHSPDPLRQAAADAIIRSVLNNPFALLRMHGETVTVQFVDGGTEDYVFNAVSATPAIVQGSLKTGSGSSAC